MNNKKYQLYVELQSVADRGIVLYLEGHPSTPESVLTAMCVNEEGAYMRDYVFDEGVLRELRFDRLGNI